MVGSGQPGQAYDTADIDRSVHVGTTEDVHTAKPGPYPAAAKPDDVVDDAADVFCLKPAVPQRIGAVLGSF